MPGYVLAATETGASGADEQPDNQSGRKSDQSGAKPGGSPVTANKKGDGKTSAKGEAKSEGKPKEDGQDKFDTQRSPP